MESPGVNTKTLATVFALMIANRKLLILRRSTKSTFGANLWDFPGGKLEGDSTTVRQDLAREVFEETSLTVNPSSLRLLDVFKKTLELSDARYPGYTMVQIVYSCPLPENAAVVLSDEHSEFHWLGCAPDLLSREFLPSKSGVVKYLASHFSSVVCSFDV